MTLTIATTFVGIDCATDLYGHFVCIISNISFEVGDNLHVYGFYKYLHFIDQNIEALFALCSTVC